MAINGKIIEALPEQGGISKKGNPWRKREYVIETYEDHPRKIAFAVMNDNIDKFNIQPGQSLAVDLDIESREYQGKWYTSVTCWRAEQII